MIYLIIGLVLLLIVTPMLSVLPSKKDRERMEKRRKAMAQGIGVELTRIDDPDPDPKKHRSSIGKPLPRVLPIAAYRLHRANDHASVDSQVAWRVMRFDHDKRSHFVEDWYWDDKATSPPPPDLLNHLSAKLPLLPPCVVRVEEKNQFISLYWNEAGDVTEVIDFLGSTIKV